MYDLHNLVARTGRRSKWDRILSSESLLFDGGCSVRRLVSKLKIGAYTCLTGTVGTGTLAHAWPKARIFSISWIHVSCVLGMDTCVDAHMLVHTCAHMLRYFCGCLVLPVSLLLHRVFKFMLSMIHRFHMHIYSFILIPHAHTLPTGRNSDFCFFDQRVVYRCECSSPPASTHTLNFRRMLLDGKYLGSHQ